MNYESKISPYCTEYNVLYIQKTKHITWYSIATWTLPEAEIKVAKRDVIAVRRLQDQRTVFTHHVSLLEAYKPLDLVSFSHLSSYFLSE